MINLSEILKNMPIGTKLWSPIFGDCEFHGVCTYSVCDGKCAWMDEQASHPFTVWNRHLRFDKYVDCYGRITEDGDCIIFPAEHKHIYIENINKIWNRL